MPHRDRPLDHHHRSILMDMDDDDFVDGEDYVVIDGDDLHLLEDEDLGFLNPPISDDEDLLEDDRVLSCQPSTDHASFVFDKHEGPVFCISSNPADETVIASGGQDDTLYVWRALTGEILLKANNFSDSVCHTAFNHNGKYLAAADMGGEIKVWKNQDSEYTPAWENRISDIQWMKWHPQANVLLAGECSGTVYVWKIPTGECKILPGHTDLTDVGAVLPDGKRAVVCYTDGSVKIFDLATTNVVEKYEGIETSQDVFIALDVHPDNNLIAVGSISSRLCVLKSQGTKSIQKFDCIEEHEMIKEVRSTSVECVLFSRNLPYNVVIAATDNALHIYDYAKCEVRGYIPIEEGVTRLAWPEGSHNVYVGTRTGMVAVCDVRAFKRLVTLEGHSQSVLDITTIMGGRTLLTTSDDGTARVFQLENIFSTLELPSPF